ncbi:hypothetical protein K469DRAFT_555982 [Zopfia rhizophila CBS 207.26]|uniref:Uncharacterized protein n=1 Tax=Zopfia rhizophila CBS 207.26 TaxID=1314779 RepID=A0A6A6ENW9_9PEZI|nr:hypothetical protein K469DRAFT_555982 [Zopfia rhizophila CBS 207.26]
MASPGMPKAMSNRLMTMKFMQRSAAKAATSEPSTPNGPPSKRVRLSNGASAPGTPGTPSDHEVIQAALAAEEKKRKEALEKAAVAAGETKWVLSFKDPQDGVRPEGMRVVQSGFAVIDGEDDKSDEGVRPVGRITFGKVVKKDVCCATSLSIMLF